MAGEYGEYGEYVGEQQSLSDMLIVEIYHYLKRSGFHSAAKDLRKAYKKVMIVHVCMWTRTRHNS